MLSACVLVAYSCACHFSNRSVKFFFVLCRNALKTLISLPNSSSKLSLCLIRLHFAHIYCQWAYVCAANGLMSPMGRLMWLLLLRAYAMVASGLMSSRPVGLFVSFNWTSLTTVGKLIHLLLGWFGYNLYVGDFSVYSQWICLATTFICGLTNGLIILVIWLSANGLTSLQSVGLWFY